MTRPGIPPKSSIHASHVLRPAALAARKCYPSSNVIVGQPRSAHWGSLPCYRGEGEGFTSAGPPTVTSKWPLTAIGGGDSLVLSECFELPISGGSCVTAGEDNLRGVTAKGDPVCWLERVCPECGALVEADLPALCWRCGIEVHPS